jgi:hypothetical protein
VRRSGQSQHPLGRARTETVKIMRAGRMPAAGDAQPSHESAIPERGQDQVEHTHPRRTRPNLIKVSIPYRLLYCPTTLSVCFVRAACLVPKERMIGVDRVRSGWMSPRVGMLGYIDGPQNGRCAAGTFRVLTHLRSRHITHGHHETDKG